MLQDFEYMFLMPGADESVINFVPHDRFWSPVCGEDVPAPRRSSGAPAGGRAAPSGCPAAGPSVWWLARRTVVTERKSAALGNCASLMLMHANDCTHTVISRMRCTRQWHNIHTRLKLWFFS